MSVRGSEKPLLPYKFFRQGAVHKRRQQLGGGGSKIGQNCQRIVQKTANMAGEGDKNSDKLPTSFMDGLQCAATEN